jgi:hypothetical protein
MNPSDTVAVTLLALIGLVMVGCLFMAVLVRRLLQKEPLRQEELPRPPESTGEKHNHKPTPDWPQARRPSAWLAVRSRDIVSVQSALGLRNAVFGPGLPDPGDDVDGAFRFLRELSRKLGHVQFFQAEPLVQHHAWVMAESGRVVRAYAWAGATVWNQGVKTTAETTLGVKCFGYGESPLADDWTVADFLVANVEKVPQIARRWSLDPAEIDVRMLANAQGIAGQHSQRY